MRNMCRAYNLLRITNVVRGSEILRNNWPELLAICGYVYEALREFKNVQKLTEFDFCRETGFILDALHGLK